LKYGKTDGTAAGTALLKDINAGAANGLTFALFKVFNGKAYFMANDLVNGQEIWSTDGTTANTRILKDIMPGPVGSFANILTTVTIGNKFLFSAMNMTNGFELWESDGTEAGTKFFKDIVAGTEGSSPFILPAFEYDHATGTVNQPLLRKQVFLYCKHIL
jgi:ELWxxDGT repeat protein